MASVSVATCPIAVLSNLNAKVGVGPQSSSNLSGTYTPFLHLQCAMHYKIPDGQVTIFYAHLAQLFLPSKSLQFCAATREAFIATCRGGPAMEAAHFMFRPKNAISCGTHVAGHCTNPGGMCASSFVASADFSNSISTSSWESINS